MKTFVLEKEGELMTVQGHVLSQPEAPYLVGEVANHLHNKPLKWDNGSIVYDSATDLAQQNEAQVVQEEQDKLNKFIRRSKFAVKVKAKIAVTNEEKSWNVSEVTTYLSDPVIQQIDSLISNVSFSSAVALMQSSDLSGYYTDEEKNAIAQMLIDYMNGE